MTENDDAERAPTPEERVAALRSDINDALAALIRLQPRLTTLETSDELEEILEGFRGNEDLVGSRSTARDLTLAEIAFVHLNDDSGDLELALGCIDRLQRYGEETLTTLRLDDVNTLIKAQLLRVLVHLRDGDRQRTVEAITAFDEAVARFEVPGDRELVERVRAAGSGSQRSEAANAVRDKLLSLFQEDVAFLIRCTTRTARSLLRQFGGG